MLEEVEVVIEEIEEIEIEVTAEDINVTMIAIEDLETVETGPKVVSIVKRKDILLKIAHNVNLELLSTKT